MFHFSIIPFAQRFSAADTGEAPATEAVGWRHWLCLDDGMLTITLTDYQIHII
jgi:hypothetical protein